MEYENCQLEVGVPLVVWRAAPSLSNWFDQNPHRLRSLLENRRDDGGAHFRALELGSGTGLLGLYTIKTLLKEDPKSHITLTDIEQSVRKFL